MSWTIPVFRTEEMAGLAGLIRAGTHASLAARLQPSEPFVLDERTLVRISRAADGRARGTNLQQPELHYFKSVLVTAGWEPSPAGLPAGLNLNDDFFDDVETWAARRTPEDKPVNHEHDCADVLGHITDNLAQTDAGELLTDDLSADALPGKFHLVTSSVLYKVWEKDELQERIERILAEIPQGKWYVSMECLFRGFDYLVVKGSTAKAVARNKDTAFLTKHLRAYGGDGLYQGQRVGRLLRNISFSGMALVRKPANPESVIFSSSAAENILFSSGRVYCPVSEESLVQSVESEQAMAVDSETLQKLQKELNALKADNDDLRAELHSGDLKTVTSAKDKAEAKAVELEKVLAETKQVARETESKLSTALTDLTEKYKATEASLKAATDELVAITADKKQSERRCALQAALKVDGSNETALKAAVALADSLVNLSDEQFQVYLAAQAALAHKVEPKTESKRPEKDPAAKNADVDILSTAKTNPEPTLAVETDSGAESLRLSIAAMLGYKNEAEQAAP